MHWKSESVAPVQRIIDNCIDLDTLRASGEKNGIMSGGTSHEECCVWRDESGQSPAGLG